MEKTKLDVVMDGMLDQIGRHAGHDPLHAKLIAEAYHFLACTRVLVPWKYAAPNATPADAVNAERA